MWFSLEAFYHLGEPVTTGGQPFRVDRVGRGFDAVSQTFHVISEGRHCGALFYTCPQSLLPLAALGRTTLSCIHIHAGNVRLVLIGSQPVRLSKGSYVTLRWNEATLNGMVKWGAQK